MIIDLKSQTWQECSVSGAREKKQKQNKTLLDGGLHVDPLYHKIGKGH
jgi:hypothetical protein